MVNSQDVCEHPNAPHVGSEGGRVLVDYLRGTELHGGGEEGGGVVLSQVPRSAKIYHLHTPKRQQYILRLHETYVYQWSCDMYTVAM